MAIEPYAKLFGSVLATRCSFTSKIFRDHTHLVGRRGHMEMKFKKKISLEIFDRSPRRPQNFHGSLFVKKMGLPHKKRVQSKNFILEE